MRAVLDTNVLISGILFSGPPSQILGYWRKGNFKTVLSHPIISEYIRVGEEINKKFPEVNIGKILEIFILNSEIIDVGTLKITECEDPDDNKFLECAIAGNCDFIVSGDRHLLKLGMYREVNILTPRDFLDNHLKVKDDKE